MVDGMKTLADAGATVVGYDDSVFNTPMCFFVADTVVVRCCAA